MGEKKKFAVGDKVRTKGGKTGVIEQVTTQAALVHLDKVKPTSITTWYSLDSLTSARGGNSQPADVSEAVDSPTEGEGE